MGLVTVLSHEMEKGLGEMQGRSGALCCDAFKLEVAAGCAQGDVRDRPGFCFGWKKWDLEQSGSSPSRLTCCRS